MRTWPTEVLDSWLWELEPQHFRVAFELVALAADEAHLVRRPLLGEILVPVGGICTTFDRLAERSRSTVKVVRTALAKLAAGGLITVESSPRGYTMIMIADPMAFGIGMAQQRHSDTKRNDSGNTPSIPDAGTAKGTGEAQQRAQRRHRICSRHSGSVRGGGCPRRRDGHSTIGRVRG